MKNSLVTSTLSILAMSLSSAAFAAKPTSHFEDYAQVKKVTPIYETVERRAPHRECWVETVRTERPRHRHNSATGTLVGGVIGGAIGHAVGHGKSNKKIGAVVGSLIGMSIGNDISRQGRHNNNRSHHEVSYNDVERCETSYRYETEEKLSGYRVSYRYHGQTYVTRMRNHPGDRIRLAVKIKPVGAY
ncbi:MAG: histidine kinase [Alteromonadaceae bacterium]|nr:MAG: histidine kinase [Alteromonadaceae bacterium]